ncbi:unnamed protein product [Dibothriocephalus latus]|uniref:Uncharacterized protein n=1 Tax=Dibothriocephalus latus TaxID=60516 RepID=A0A3P6UA55_DIBLA|nr:unnamed protein product [Dibothriocephalus latus]
MENENAAGKTALMLAAFKGNTECVCHLIEAGARIDHADRSGLSAIHYAVDGEHRATVQRLIELGADPNAKDSNLQWTPLLRCAGLKNNGNTDVAQQLILMGARIDEQDVHGKTALHNAIICKHAALCQLLLEHGASLTIETKVIL